MKWRALLLSVLVLLFTFLQTVTLASAQESGEKTFGTPQDAGKGLDEAVQSGDKAALLSVLGESASSVISSGDEVQDKNNREMFLKRFQQMNRWGAESNGDQTLYLGAENWPFPIPLKKDAAGQWYFDSKAGVQEILFRRIGKNELATIRVCGVLVDAQQDYFQQIHDGDTAHQYAQKFISDPGKQNGLYWKVAEGQPESPIGPLVAYATGEGYGGQHDSAQPFHGYFYRILTAQGKDAPGGSKSYLIDGRMTGGFAFLAYPAEYRNSGVMTFLVDQNGTVYEKDLGPDTAAIAKQMKAYNPDKSWRVAEAGDEAEESSAAN